MKNNETWYEIPVTTISMRGFEGSKKADGSWKDRAFILKRTSVERVSCFNGLFYSEDGRALLIDNGEVSKYISLSLFPAYYSIYQDLVKSHADENALFDFFETMGKETEFTVIQETDLQGTHLDCSRSIKL